MGWITSKGINQNHIKDGEKEFKVEVQNISKNVIINLLVLKNHGKRIKDARYFKYEK